MRNKDRKPLEYTIAKAVNGQLIAGGRVVGSAPQGANGAHIVVRTGGSLLALPTNTVKV